MTDSLQTLITAVQTADSSTKLIGSVRQLAATADIGAIPTLIDTLGYNNPGAAVAAVDGLVAIGEPAIPAILDQLDQHNYTARSWAIRALAGIGDPRGLVTLLGAATADFAVSVRRAAARGLGSMKWHWFPPDVLEIAQEEALEALLFAATQDDEWIVRYSAIVGLQSLAIAVRTTYPQWNQQITSQIRAIAINDECLTVRARCIMAQRHLSMISDAQPPASDGRRSFNLEDTEWQRIMVQLYERKQKERQAFPEGDPQRFRSIAADLRTR
ncbi:MAG: HEAT repeat domain-containing protein [Leptolyngbyaceae bacterium]|nr:HEAT repeat domain-containing protein [Leptolyngbyaceae bacterium]